MVWYPNTLVIICFLLLVCFAFYLLRQVRQERIQLRDAAYQEGVGEEFDLELRRLQERQSLQPQDAPSGIDPYHEALDKVRLEKRVRNKNILSGNKPVQPVTYLNISGSTIAALNLGTVVGDLTASVQTLQTHGHQQVADAIRTLMTAIGESKDIKDGNRKDLLENLALVSREASSHPDQRRSGLLKSSLGFITTSLAAANKLIPLVHDLHERLRAAGLIDW